MQNEDAVIKFKDAVQKAKNQTFSEGVISSLYFFFIISYAGAIYDYKSYKLAWFLINHQELL